MNLAIYVLHKLSAFKQQLYFLISEGEKDEHVHLIEWNSKCFWGWAQMFTVLLLNLSYFIIWNIKVII